MTEKKTAEEFEAEQRAIPDDRLAEMAQNALSRLCETGGRSITMTVPPRIDDTDMVIAEVIRRFKAYAAQQNPDLGGNVKKFAAQQKSEIAQRCLVCGGYGMVLNGFYNTVTGIASTTSIIPETCRTCNGSGVYEQKSEIELPTDEEIQEAQLAYEESEEQTKIRFDTAYCFRDFMAGIEWLRNQITEK